MDIIAEVLDKVHVTDFGQQQVAGLLGEGHLGARQPGPVVGVGAPGVWVLDGEGEPVVDGRHGDARGLALLLLRLEVLDQPVVVAAVRVADDVVKDNQLLKL